MSRSLGRGVVTDAAVRVELFAHEPQCAVERAEPLREFLRVPGAPR